jgi:hypothetical protein
MLLAHLLVAATLGKLQKEGLASEIISLSILT